MSKQDDELREPICNAFGVKSDDWYDPYQYENRSYLLSEVEAYIQTHYIPKAEVLRALEAINQNVNQRLDNGAIDNFTSRGYLSEEVERTKQALGLTSKETEE